jgi:hypothetical protein
MPSWVWDVVLIVFGVCEAWVFFIEPSIQKREDASSRKRREEIERRREQLALDREELKILREELEARRKEKKE